MWIAERVLARNHDWTLDAAADAISKMSPSQIDPVKVRQGILDIITII